MATTVYNVEEIELQNGSKIKLKPLSIKALRLFMAEIQKTQSAENEDETLTILINACGIAIQSQLPDLVANKDLLDLILYAVEEIKMFNDLGNNAANMNTLPKKLYVYRNRCNNLIKDVKNIFF